MRKIVTIDLFCGAGGLTRGFLEAGIQVLAGIDVDSNAKKLMKSITEFHIYKKT